MATATAAGRKTSSEIDQLRARLADLERRVDYRTREITTLHEILLEISRQTDLSLLLRLIVEKAAGLLNARMGGLYLLCPDDTLELVVAHNLPGDFVGTHLGLGEGLSGRVAQTGQVILVADYQNWDGRAGIYAQALFKRVVGVPLKIDGKVIGVINVMDDQVTGAYAEDEVRLVALFAEQAAIAIEKAQLFEQLQQELAENYRAAQVQSSLFRISEAIHTAQSLDKLYRSIHEIIADLMPARNFAIALYDGATESFVFPYRVDEHDPHEITPPPRPVGRTLVDYVWQTGVPVLATAGQLEQLIRDQNLQPVGVLALDWLGVPLKWQDKLIGVMVVQTYTAGVRLTEEHQRLLMFVSTQIAMAIERKRAEQMQQSIYRVSEAAHAARNLDELYRLIHQIVGELMPARNFGIALYDTASDMLHFPYYVDESYQLAAPPPRRRSNGLIEYVLRTGCPLLGTQQEIRALIEREQLQPGGNPAQSWLGVPLQGPDRALGVIVVQTYQPGEWLTEEHKQVLAFVSTQVMAAIERKRAEQLQQAVYRISEAAHAASSLDELSRAVHAIVNELMPANNFYIALYDEASDLITFPYIVDEYDDSDPVDRPGKGLTAYVLRTGRPLLATPEVFDDMVRRGEAELIGGSSVDWLGVPLKVQSKVIGVITVQSYSEHVRLTEEHLDLLGFVSTQVAMAIQRKRAEEALRESEEKYRTLFEAAQRQAQELTLLDRVRTAVTRELNLSELFRTVVTAIAETFGYTLVSLYLLEETTLRLQHQVGYPFVLTEIPITSGVIGRVARISQPVLVEDVFSDPAFLATRDDILSELGVPLFDAGRTVGVLNIESTNGFRLTQADLRLMVALSEHVSSAISRARLYTEARQNAARLKAAVESLPFDFWAMDLTRQYVLQNSISVQHWGKFVGRRIEQLDLPAAVPEHWQSNNQRAFAGEVVQDDIVYEVAGMPRHYHEIIAPIWSEGEIQGIIGVNIDITDRQRAEDALRASEARLRAVTTNIPMILFALDQQGIYTFIEGQGVEGASDLFENALGRSIFDVAHYVPRVTEALQLALAGESLDVVFNLNQRAFEVWLSPITSPAGEFSGVIGVAVDMTEREHTAQALRDSEERYRVLFESNPYPMWAYDLGTLAFLAVNDAAVRHYGYSREEFLRMTIADIRPPEDLSRLHEHLAEPGAYSVRSGVWRHRTKAGEVIDVEITSHNIILDERPARVVLATDITERRRTEEALRRAQKMESLGILAGGIAHDFNNLLVAILGQTSLALSQLRADSPARLPVEKAVAASRRAAELTRQLLAYSGRGQFEHRSIDLNRLIQENLHLFAVAVPKQVELRSELTEPLPLMVGDAGQLQQVIMNLIINAAEAIGDRAGQVMVRTGVRNLSDREVVAWQIGEETLSAGGYVVLEVQDNGQGMDAQTLSKIFDPFFTTKFTGRGLGLAAVQGIVRGHHGGLKVTSNLSLGTTFEIVFPIGIAAPAEPIAVEALQEVEAAQQLILVIDDEEPVRDAVTDILELEGLAVITAPDGRTGIDLFQKRRDEIRLVLLDLSMPGLNGEATFHELRVIDPHVRVLLSSGYSHDEVTARFAGQGEVGFIQKPYDADRLVHEVKRHMMVSTND